MLQTSWGIWQAIYCLAGPAPIKNRYFKRKLWCDHLIMGSVSHINSLWQVFPLTCSCLNVTQALYTLTPVEYMNGIMHATNIRSLMASIWNINNFPRSFTFVFIRCDYLHRYGHKQRSTAASISFFYQWLHFFLNQNSFYTLCYMLCVYYNYFYKIKTETEIFDSILNCF